ncbi:MAG: MarR family transcriptional regulator [Bacillaceae bacterium]|nr:MarR family transcriptional regulator [Bacillaceae bacterium]
MKNQHIHELVDRYENAKNAVYRKMSYIMQRKVHQDLTSDQFATLRFIQYHQPCTSSRIAEEFSIGKSSVTAQINRLFKMGYITRKRDEKDRRVVYLSLTKKGEELIHMINENLYDVLGDILSNFKDEEIQTFIKLYEKFAKIVDDHE